MTDQTDALVKSLREALAKMRDRAETAEARLSSIEEDHRLWDLPGGETVPLTFTERAICKALFDRRPSGVAKEGLMTYLYSLRPNDHPEIKIIDVLVCKARQKLKGTRWRIETVWGTGYRLVEVASEQAVA